MVRGGSSGRPIHYCFRTWSRRPIYNSINFSDTQPFGQAPMPVNNPANSTATYTVISGFNCPSDTDRLTDPNGHNNYMDNSGSAPNLCIRWQRECTWRGADRRPDRSSTRPMESTPGPRDLAVLRSTSPAITDGTSNTAAFSERVKAIGSNFTGTSAPFDRLKPTASLSIPAAVSNTLERTPQAYYQICSVTPPVPFNGNQDAANFMDDNISGSMWVSGQPALHALLARHAAQHLELPFRAPDRVTWPIAGIRGAST